MQNYQNMYSFKDKKKCITSLHYAARQYYVCKQDFSFSYHTCIYVHITNLHPPHYSSLEALKLSNGCTHLQILMNVGQHLETVNTDVEIHWDHTSATAMKDIHCNRVNAKVSLLKIQLILQRHVQDDKQSSSQILYVE